jgi:hypothetical protein
MFAKRTGSAQRWPSFLNHTQRLHGRSSATGALADLRETRYGCGDPMFALRCAVGLVLLVSGAGCTRGVAPSARPNLHKQTRTRPQRARHAAKAECAATYKNKCFASADEACAFAGCADQRCDVIESIPARVSCDDMR